VSDTVSRGTEAVPQAEALAAAKARGWRDRRRGGRVVVGVVVVLAAAAVSVWQAGVFSAAGSPGAGQVRLSAPATAVVVRENLSAVTPVAATLGYAGTYTVTGQDGGTLTSVPEVGQVISQGQVLYRVDDGVPVVLLYGTVPDWRALGEGVTGADVAQLNRDLVAMGDAASADVAAAGWHFYSWATAAGVQQLEEHLGVAVPPGSLSLGQVVFEPGAIRVTQVTGSLGSPASGQVLTATSDEHAVTIALDTSQESEVKAGDTVSVMLPDGTSAAGVISQVGTVATTAPASDGSGSTTTIPVTVRLTDPAAAGGLDQAPVTVYITTATVRGVLAVPVTALLARPGGYDVEVAGPGNTRRYVPVGVGPVFDNNSGLVQVTGSLAPGQRVVVASS
jgi:hypothetical protein